MQWKENELIGRRQFNEAMFNLDIAIRINRIELGLDRVLAYPHNRLIPYLEMTQYYAYRLTGDIVSLLNKYNVPKPIIKKTTWC